MSDSASDWTSEFKFSSFYKSHYSSKVPELKEILGSDCEVVPSYFDKRRRTLHYAYILEDWMNCKGKADKAIQKKKEDLKDILEKLDKLKDDITDTEAWLQWYSKLKDDITDTEAWLQWYFNWPSPPTWAEEGIAYRILQEKIGCDWAVFFLSQGDVEDKRSIVSFWNKNKKTVLVNRKVKEYYRLGSDCNEKELKLEDYKDICYEDADELAQIQADCLKIFTGDDKDDDAIQTYWKKPCLVFPIREIYLGYKGYGGIWGFLTIFLESGSGDIDAKKVASILTSISPNMTAAAYDYFNSGLWNVEEETWDNSDDIIEHFLKTIPYIQDWKNIWITKDNEAITHWGREQNSFMTEWKKKECEKYDTAGFEWELRNIQMFLINEDEQDFCKDILNSKICCEYPEISSLPKEDNDKNLFEDKLQEQQLKVFEIVINKWRQWRAKDQLTRSALRNAVSAIMGRNMSHNIGSHVIARYAAVAGQDTEQRKSWELPKEGIEDHRSVFLRYLQRRMDFIAEVSTSDKSNWSQPLGLVEVLAALNLQKEKERINTNEKNNFEPILLSYITGKESIKASVCIDTNTDKYFNCPGGEVGAHALYVILENIIRNSARHNTGLKKDKVVKLKVEVTDSKYPELLELKITDCQTDAKKKVKVSGKPLDEHINDIIKKEPFLNSDGSPNSHNWGIREMQICAQYLRGLPLSDLETSLSISPPVLKAMAKQKNSKSRLTYRLYLQRPRLCAIVTKEFEQHEKLKNMGISLHQGKPDNAADYSFLVLPPNPGNKKEKTELPIRTLYVDINEPLLKKVANSSDSKTLKDLLKEVDNSSDPMILLGQLHKVLWRRYLDQRNSEKVEKIQDIRTYVGWDIETPPTSSEFFQHEQKGSLIKRIDSIKEELKSSHLGGMMWFDHASRENLDAVKEPIIFSEILDSSSPHRSLLEATQTKAIGNELIAAALGRVTVLDERVQNEKQREYRGGIKYEDLWPCMGIKIPSNADLNNPKFCEIQQFIQNSSAEFLVLHLTILESLTKHCSFNSEQDTLDKLMDGVEDCEVIIVTGRGVPSVIRHSDAPNGNELQARYLPISALLEYLISRPSKLALMRALWHANATP